jgi:sec-independent protein translocase protein TatB
VFNVTGGELVIILLVALIVLGPEKLPEAIRKFGRVYGELRRMSAGFQSELRDALDEPMREMRDTVDSVKSGFQLGDDGDTPASSAPSDGPSSPAEDGAAAEIVDDNATHAGSNGSNGTAAAADIPAPEKPVAPADPD